MIHEITDKFDFEKLSLCKPVSNSSGSFFMKYSIDEKPLYIKPPKCSIKQNMNKQGKKYCDLIFQPENDAFIRWMDNLETRSHQLLFDHRQEWFKTDLEKDDIEHSFTFNKSVDELKQETKALTEWCSRPIWNRNTSFRFEKEPKYEFTSEF